MACPSVSLTFLKRSRSRQVSGDNITSLGACQRMLQFLVQQRAIGQIRERVVKGHVRDLGVGASLLGDVLVGRDPAAIRHGLMRDGDDASIGKRLDLGRGIPFTHGSQPFVYVFLRSLPA